MNDVTIKTIDQIDYYKGPHAKPGIKFHSAGRDLGVTSWGMNVIEIEPNYADYPDHNHADDRQEEVYVILKGSGTLITPDGEERVREGMLMRIGPDTNRKFIAGEQGVTLLALGGTPGKAYEPRS